MLILAMGFLLYPPVVLTEIRVDFEAEDLRGGKPLEGDGFLFGPCRA